MSSRFTWKLQKFIKDNCPCQDCKPPTRYGGCKRVCEEFIEYEKAYTELRKCTEQDKIANEKKYGQKFLDIVDRKRQRRLRS